MKSPHPAIHLEYTDPRRSSYISFRRLSEYSCNHVHGAVELLYLFTGKREFFINDRTVALIPGEVLLIGSNVVHKAANPLEKQCEGVLIYLHATASGTPEDKHSRTSQSSDIPAALPSLFDAQFRLIRLDTARRSAVEELLSGMKREMGEKREGYELSLQCQLGRLFVTLGRVVQEESTPVEILHPSGAHERISRIAEFINSNYMEQVSLQQISDRFFLSPAYFSRLFKKTTGYTFVEYLNTVRVREAIHLLQEGEMKVTTIADAVGFGSITHFGRVFRQITGYHPSYFRKHA